MSRTKITPADMADAAVWLAHHGSGVDEVWLFDSDLYNEARQVGRKVLRVTHEDDQAYYTNVNHPCFVLPVGYRLLLSVTPDFISLGSQHYAVVTGWDMSRQGEDGVVRPELHMLARLRDGYYLTDLRELEPDALALLTEKVTGSLWARWWATSSKVARSRGYCERIDQGRRSTSHRDVPLISVVRWRKITYERGDGQRDVEWSHRWMVRGHLRRLRDGRIVEVREHVKGPKGLPLVVKVQVNELVR